jgi:hypothetical protein
LFSAICLWTVAAVAAAIPFSSIEKGSASGITTPTTLVVRRQEDWHRIWARHASVRTPTPGPPQIDFSQEIVIAVFAGERMTGGFTVQVTAIEESAGVIRVTYREIGPPPDSLLTQALTQPYHLVTTPRVEGLIIFERHTSQD